METGLILLNAGLLLGSAFVLWSLWRRGEARLQQVAAAATVDAAPSARPDARPVAQLMAELAAARAESAARLAEVRRQLQRVEHAFDSGLRDGRGR